MGSFSESLWKAIAPTYAAILEHPFVRGLTAGDLPENAFRYYVIQDSHYLKSFSRGLALLGAKADSDDDLMMFCEHARNGIAVERALHAGFLDAWGMQPEQVAATELAPNCLFYSSYLLRVAYERPYAEGLGAFLPCYWIYREVGLALQEQGSPNPLYQRWIDTYGGEEFGAIVNQVLGVVERVAASLTDEQREAVKKHFVITSKMEYLFWDMGYRRQEWPIG